MWSVWVNRLSSGVENRSWDRVIASKHRPVHDRWCFLVLLGLMIAVQLTDAISTQALVGIDAVREANPLVSGTINTGLFLPLKVLGLVIVSGLLWWLSQRLPRLAVLVTIITLILGNGVLFWNASVLFF